MLHPSSIFVQPLSFPPIAWIGTISCSLYVWQEFFMGLHNLFAVIVLLPLCVLASYYWIERPFTRLGHRLTRSRLQA
jgi:peptidoglycan/LPS O-acetylase OafA/YrhL